MENPAIRERGTLRQLTSLQYHTVKQSLRFAMVLTALAWGSVFPLFAVCLSGSAPSVTAKIHPFRPCGKTCTASFSGYARKNAVLLRFYLQYKALRKKVFIYSYITQNVKVSFTKILGIDIYGNFYQSVHYSGHFIYKRKLTNRYQDFW